jgi:hypothetical protein
LKLTFEAILNECNRLALEQESRAQRNWLSSRLIRLKTEYEKGVIDDDTYSRREAEILNELDKLSMQDNI